jgi:hypothetical protein
VEEAPDTVETESLKLFKDLFQRYQRKVNGAVPPGLSAVIDPFRVPELLQNIKIGSDLPVVTGYEVFLSAFASVDESWPIQAIGINNVMKIKP